MQRRLQPLAGMACIGAILAACLGGCHRGQGPHVEQRDRVSYLRGPYNWAFYDRHNGAFSNGAAIHFAHGLQHDVLELTDIDDHGRVDVRTDARYVDMVFDPPQTEPSMELYGPYIARALWQLYRAIDWTHMHHEQTYDILSDPDIAWHRKQEWTRRSVEYYLHQHDIPRSPAPLDITMRRAAVMMKPYATWFRTHYPRSNNFFYYAHWWHPAVYEAMMIAGNDDEQDTVVSQTDNTGWNIVIHDRPLRMLLSREIMPRYSRLSPASANIFDNLHMLHGIAYDILAYPHWTIEQKREELYRVIQAMSYQPGDEQYARKFTIPHPDMDPRVYEPWMKSVEGDMNRIMVEMLEEMMPLMMPPGESMTPEMHQQAMEQLRLKLTPGLQQGEQPGSIADALRTVMPNMQMDPTSSEPGATPQKMIDAMLAGWQEKYGDLPDVEPWPMDREPQAPPRPAPAEAQAARHGPAEVHVAQQR